jgi:hypothetical protein
LVPIVVYFLFFHPPFMIFSLFYLAGRGTIFCMLLEKSALYIL